MNKSIILGRLTKEPEIRYSQINNTKVATFTLAVDRKYAKAGEERETDFINIVAYTKLADITEKYLSKGSQICICGRIQTRNYEDKNGIKRYVTEIVAEELYFTDSKRENENSDNSTKKVNDVTDEETEEMIANVDDLPF